MAACFASEDSARLHFRKILWPNGFRCQTCSAADFKHLSTRDLYQCKRCRHQQSLTSGTPLHKTRTPLRIWAELLFYSAHPHLAKFEHVAKYYNLSETHIRRLQPIKQPDTPLYRLAGQLLHYLNKRSLS
jgi:hypothetical protein